MLKFTYYGNCQLGCIKDFLLTNTIFTSVYEYIKITYIHSMNESEFDSRDEILKDIDFIIIQPINDNYKNNYKFSTNYVLGLLKKDCKVIMLPSLFFGGYSPYTGHLVSDGKFILQPMPLHDKKLHEIYIKHSGNRDLIIEEYKHLVLNKNALDPGIFINDIDKSINELKTRENEMKKQYNITDTLIYSDFVINNYKDNLLCYTESHPTRFTFIYFTNLILNILNISIQSYPENLDPERKGILPFYKSLENVVNFNISEDIIINNYPVSLDQFIKRHLDIYDTYDLNELSTYK